MSCKHPPYTRAARSNAAHEASSIKHAAHQAGRGLYQAWPHSIHVTCVMYQTSLPSQHTQVTPKLSLAAYTTHSTHSTLVSSMASQHTQHTRSVDRRTNMRCAHDSTLLPGWGSLLRPLRPPRPSASLFASCPPSQTICGGDGARATGADGLLHPRLGRGAWGQHGGSCARRCP